MTTALFTDKAKLLGDVGARQARISQLNEAHIGSLTAFVKALRNEMGPEAGIPYFDPWDGGVRAELLYLLEAPGAKAVQSGFISRNNPDETAKNFFELNRDANIPRSLTLSWNIIPWYIGSKSRIRPANSRDISAGIIPLGRLLDLLPRLKAVVLLGKKAEKASELISQIRPELQIFRSPHPSPLFVNNAPSNRQRILNVLVEARDYISTYRSAS